jgi:hypothetical protein
MKAEDSDKKSKLDIMSFEGVKPQVDADAVTKVILSSGSIVNCLKGSFHFYITRGDKPMPYVQFDTEDIGTGVMRVELWPTNVAGVAYYDKS